MLRKSSSGELFVDLKGAWQDDVEVDVDFSMGEVRVWLPENVRVNVERASVGVGESSIDRPRSERCRQFLASIL